MQHHTQATVTLCIIHHTVAVTHASREQAHQRHQSRTHKTITTHCDVAHATRHVLFVHQDTVVVLATSVTASTRVATMLACATARPTKPHTRDSVKQPCLPPQNTSCQAPNGPHAARHADPAPTAVPHRVDSRQQRPSHDVVGDTGARGTPRSAQHAQGKHGDPSDFSLRGEAPPVFFPRTNTTVTG